jgi:hypothetical protein
MASLSPPPTPRKLKASTLRRVRRKWWGLADDLQMGVIRLRSLKINEFRFFVRQTLLLPHDEVSDDQVVLLFHHLRGPDALEGVKTSQLAQFLFEEVCLC